MIFSPGLADETVGLVQRSGMGPHGKDLKDDRDVLEMPGESRSLYSWKDLHGAKYRDSSVSRRESRIRAAQQVREHAVTGEPATHFAGADRRHIPITTPTAPSPAKVWRDRRADVAVEEDIFDAQAFPENEIPTRLPPPYVTEPETPAWLRVDPVPPPQPSVADTLQHSRERLASRWFALKGAFEPSAEESAPARQKEIRTPVLAVFSLAGGVGKTTLTATLGRTLSSMGEKVLLADTSAHGLLPFYFGASELRPGVVRTFTPPSGSTDSPIYLVNHDMEEKAQDESKRQSFIDELLGNSQGTHRILLDVAVTSSWVVRQAARLNPTVLVPVAPDMNSVINLQFAEKFFQGIGDGEGRPLQPFYVLNQFDPSLPLHLDVREVLRRQLGDRLLPMVVRRAPSVSEALAEGMTVMDYAPEESIIEDYLSIATWLRGIAAPAAAGFRNIRWSERDE